LEVVVAQRIEAQVLSNAARVRLGSMNAKLRRLVLAAKGPDAAREHRAGVRNRRVVVDSEPSEPGLLGVHAYLPAQVAVAFRDTLEVLQGELAKADRVSCDAARKARKDWERRRHAAHTGGEDLPPEPFHRRTKDQRLADALAILVLGPDASDPSVPARPRFLVQLTMSLPTLLALREGAAELPGYGPVPADIAREWATDADWQRFVHDPVTGYLLDDGPARYRPTAATLRFIKHRDVKDRFPGSPRNAQHADADHTRSWRPDGTGGTTSSAGMSSLSRIGHIAKTHNHWSVHGDANTTLTWTSPHGLTCTTTPHDYTDGTQTHPAPQADPGPPPF
jgi:hypothetical protein